MSEWILWMLVLILIGDVGVFMAIGYYNFVKHDKDCKCFQCTGRTFEDKWISDE